MHTLTIPGKPIPWSRARRKGNKYFDIQIHEKKRYQWLAKTTLEAFEATLDPLKLDVECHMPIPKYDRLKRPLKRVPHIRKPDSDNLIKFICDAFNGVIWVDDKQIWEIHFRKFYAKEPKTILRWSSVINTG